MFFNENKKQFEQTVRAYSADLYRFAYGLCRDRFVAEDLVQQTFERAWKNWKSLGDVVAVKSWLLTILRREHARLYERKKLDTTEEDLDTLEVFSPNVPTSHVELEQFVASLPLTYREPLLLQVLGGFACSEIAEILEISEGAVMTRLTRARQMLRAELQPVERRGAN
jgi:RNA polymerase sigma-70 factor (ECF subfamily)